MLQISGIDAGDTKTTRHLESRNGGRSLAVDSLRLERCTIGSLTAIKLSASLNKPYLLEELVEANDRRNQVEDGMNDTTGECLVVLL